VASPRKTNAAFSGSWHIVETELWDQDALDTVQPAFLKFDDESIGSLGMIVIGAGLDCRFGTATASRSSSSRSRATTTVIRAAVAGSA